MELTQNWTILQAWTVEVWKMFCLLCTSGINIFSFSSSSFVVDYRTSPNEAHGIVRKVECKGLMKVFNKHTNGARMTEGKYDMFLSKFQQDHMKRFIWVAWNMPSHSPCYMWNTINKLTFEWRECSMNSLKLLEFLFLKINQCHNVLTCNNIIILDSPLSLPFSANDEPSPLWMCF